MVRTTLDVNVLVSAAIAPLGIPRRLWLDAQLERFSLVSSDPILSQTTTKLRLPRIARRYDLSNDDVRIFVEAVRAAADLVPLSPAEISPVTGDRGLLALGTCERTAIVSPRRFFELLEAHQP